MPIPKSAFRRAERRVGNTPSFVFDDAEHAWHMEHLRGLEAESYALVFALVAVALSHPRTWAVLAQAVPWLGRHGLRDDVRWRVWYYFSTRLPMRGSPRDACHFGLGVAHGLAIWIGPEFHKSQLGLATDASLARADALRAARTVDLSLDAGCFTVAMNFAGRAADCGDHPNKVSIQSHDLLRSKRQFIRLIWNGNGHLKDITFRRTIVPRQYCSTCNGLRILDCHITYGDRSRRRGTVRTVSIADACLTCRWANLAPRTSRVPSAFNCANNIPEMVRADVVTLRTVVESFEALMRAPSPAPQRRNWPRLSAGRRPVLPAKRARGAGAVRAAKRARGAGAADAR
jgi:hypothetical protein